MPKAAPIQIPEPENVTISEEYGAGSIVIMNRERNDDDDLTNILRRKP